MMSRERKDCANPCPTCPFVVSNFGKPNPEGYDPRRQSEESRTRDFHDWYSEKNLRRLWSEGIRRGKAMICHATDPHAPEYGGKAVAPGNERLCVGALVLAFRHAKFVESLIDAEPEIKPAETMTRYRAAAGRFPMTRNGLIAWMMMINLGRTELMGGLPIPLHISAAAAETVGVPWRDDISAERKDVVDASA